MLVVSVTVFITANDLSHCPHAVTAKSPVENRREARAVGEDDRILGPSSLVRL